MHVLLSGASGFVGRKLGQELVRRGHRVTALLRGSADLPFPAELCSWDDESPLEVDAFIHLAGETIAQRWTGQAKDRIVKSRTETCARVAKRLPRPLKVCVSAAAIGIYGNRGDELLPITAPPGTGFLTDTCLAWEQAAIDVPADRTVLLRLGMILGREGGAFREVLPMFKRGLGGRLGTGKQWVSWIHIEDVIQLFAAALEDPAWKGPQNAVAPEPVRNSEFTRVLSETIKSPSVLPAPSTALKLALGEMSHLLLDSQNVRESVSALGYSFRYPRLIDAIQALCKDVEISRGLRCHEHVSECWVPRSTEQVFRFFTSTRHLERLFPGGLKVSPQSAERLEAGASYEYEMECFGLTWHCRAHVLDFTENQSFSTTHQKGPFAFWLHQHHFEPLRGGTLVRHRIIYRLKGGYAADVGASKIVEEKLSGLFRGARGRLREI